MVISTAIFFLLNVAETPKAGQPLPYIHWSAKVRKSTPLTFLQVLKNECVDSTLFTISPVKADKNTFGNTLLKPSDVPDLPNFLSSI